MAKLLTVIVALLLLPAAAYAQAAKADIIETKIICMQEGRYIGWPTICRMQSGKLLIAFSGDRDHHICPWGKSQIITSDDDGKTWTAPVTVNCTPLDDRDTGLVETPKGTLLLTWFTSVAFDRKPEYVRSSEKATPEIRQQWLGNWTRRSTDGGATWLPPVRMTTTAPHGSIVLRDGRLLQVGKIDNNEFGLAAETSIDDGQSWQITGTIPIPAGEGYNAYHEPHVVQRPDGTLVALFRCQPENEEQHTMRQSESTDGGRTWTCTHSTGIWGYPPHLLLLADGRIVVTYGRRKEPFSERACVSTDGGATWDTANEITLCDAVNKDHGYPSSVQLADGSILTVYYQDPGPDKDTCLWSTHWRLAPQ